MKLRTFNLLAGTSLLALASAASAQTTSSGTGATASGEMEEIVSLEEIVVTARRKEESQQDVPTTINAVTGEQIDKLSIKKFEDIATVVPGLAMSNNANGIGATASVRGVNYDVNASGNNGTVEFYMNDAPISAGNLFQTVYDIQQVELLRGPQGTLRGRASPSGSMTVITRRPDLQEMGGTVNLSANNIGGWNVNGGFGIPIISDMLAIRVAAAYDKSEANRVVSLFNAEDPSAKNKSGRATVRFDPTDTLSFVLTAQKTKSDSTTFAQAESQQEINPNAPVVHSVISPPLIHDGVTFIPATNDPSLPPYIAANQRLSVMDRTNTVAQDFNNYNLQIQWAFAGQKLNYVGARNEQKFDSSQSSDAGNYFSPLAPTAAYQGFGQDTYSESYATAHELRLSNEERVFGMFDYIVGAFYQKTNAPTDLTTDTPVFTGAAQFVATTPISIHNNGTEEKSGFVNLTAHLGDAWEVSGGARYIKYSDSTMMDIGGVNNPQATHENDYNTTIYTGSVKYNISSDLMVYGTVGTSWRPGINAIGDFSLARSDLENSFLNLPPEKSTSFEVGAKSTLFDKRLRINGDFYHQKFTNYPYRSPGGVYYVNTAPPAAGGVGVNLFNFVAAVPVEVNGAEVEVNFQATKDWEMGLSAAVSKGEIKDGFIPCTDLNGDGVPDPASVPPSVSQIQGGDPAKTISGCTVTQRASSAPQWSGTLESEYRLPVTTELTSFVRGQMPIYGPSKNDPLNAIDDIPSYVLLNMYLGLRDSKGVWEVAVYGKNVTNTQEVLARGASTMSVNLNNSPVGTNYYGSGATATTGLTMTAPREFGLNLRYSFGSK